MFSPTTYLTAPIHCCPVVRFRLAAALVWHLLLIKTLKSLRGLRSLPPGSLLWRLHALRWVASKILC